MKKFFLIFGLGAAAFMTLVVFGVGYFLYALIPGGQEFLGNAKDGVIVVDQDGRRVERKLSAECVTQLEQMTNVASIWSMFQVDDWKSMMPKNCLQDLNMDVLLSPEDPSPKTDVEWEAQNSETI